MLVARKRIAPLNAYRKSSVSRHWSSNAEFTTGSSPDYIMRTLICGSIAYDTIMVFKDRFKNHILPNQTQVLNGALLVPGMRREFGGCAGNIAYSLQMLGGDPLIMATVGQDSQPCAYR